MLRLRKPKDHGNERTTWPPDGKWRPFPEVPHLLQYVSNNDYYARIRINGKLIRESLETGVGTTAKLRLTDFLKEQQEACASPISSQLERGPTGVGFDRVFAPEGNARSTVESGEKGFAGGAPLNTERTAVKPWVGIAR